MSRQDGAVRLFVAIDLPETAKEALRQVVADLQGSLQQGIRWVRPEGIHLTLKFLGDVSTARVGDIQEAMERAAREFGPANIRLSLSGLGVFPNSPRTSGALGGRQRGHGGAGTFPGAGGRSPGRRGL